MRETWARNVELRKKRRFVFVGDRGSVNFAHPRWVSRFDYQIGNQRRRKGSAGKRTKLALSDVAKPLQSGKKTGFMQVGGEYFNFQASFTILDDAKRTFTVLRNRRKSICEFIS